MKTTYAVGDKGVATILFTHVDPSTGKLTSWTIAQRIASLEDEMPYDVREVSLGGEVSKMA